MADLVRAAVAFLIVPNVPFWILGQFVYTVRSLINVDYLLLGVIAPRRRGWVAAGFSILLVIDVVAALSPIYHYPLADVIPSIPDVEMLASRAVAPLALLGILAVGGLATAAVFVVRPQGRARLAERAVLLGIALVVAGADLINGSNSLVHRGALLVPSNLATSAVFRTQSAFRRFLEQRTLTLRASVPEPVVGATRELLLAARSEVDGNGAGTSDAVVLVMVESLGLARDWARSEFFRTPFVAPAIRERYTVRFGSVPFAHGTTSGEFRELCGVAFDHYRALVQGVAAECLPAELQRLGYETVAIHGYRRNFFGRATWYPAVGFSRTLFLEDLAPRLGGRRCGVLLPGICDLDAARVVAQELRKSGTGRKRFLYWLTLNSHLPVDRTIRTLGTFSCDTDPEAARDRSLCMELQLWQQVAIAVAQVAADPSLAPAHYVVVGDHAPPFARRSERDLFVPDSVPFVELIPRGPGH